MTGGIGWTVDTSDLVDVEVSFFSSSFARGYEKEVKSCRIYCFLTQNVKKTYKMEKSKKPIFEPCHRRGELPEFVK